MDSPVVVAMRRAVDKAIKEAGLVTTPAVVQVGQRSYAEGYRDAIAALERFRATLLPSIHTVSR